MLVFISLGGLGLVDVATGVCAGAGGALDGFEDETIAGEACAGAGACETFFSNEISFPSAFLITIALLLVLGGILKFEDVAGEAAGVLGVTPALCPCSADTADPCGRLLRLDAGLSDN